MSDRPDFRLDRVRWGDVAWLASVGLSPELIGRQYHWAETPLQLVVAPGRALSAPYVAACLVWVGDRRAGYIGRSPLSGNYEYLLQPWARSSGLGRAMISDFLAHHRAGDRSRAFFVSSSNPRSLRALLGALADIDWQEGEDYRVTSNRFGQLVRVKAGRERRAQASMSTATIRVGRNRPTIHGTSGPAGSDV